MLPEFPEFKKLTLEDKQLYNELVKDYPPFADISFTNLHIWWNLGGKLAASTLNSNLVLNYDLPFDKPNCGWGLIGTINIDESISAIFDYLSEHNRQKKIVHMPEFTVEKIADKSLYDIREETDFHEYIMSSEQLAKLEGKPHSRTRRKVGRFLRETEDSNLDTQHLNLGDKEVRELVSGSIEDWHNRYPSSNDPERLEEVALEKTLTHSPTLGTLNTCIFIDDKLHGIALYHPTPGGEHYIINHLRVDYQYPHVFDYLTQQVAEQAVKNDVSYLNMEMDLGLEGLRHHKMGLRPVKFYKKFTVRPKS